KRVIFFVIISYILLFLLSVLLYDKQQKNMETFDSGRLIPVKVKQVKSLQSVEKLQQLLTESDDLFSISGMQHTQGGHTMYPNATMLDMKTYNEVLEVDVEGK